MPVEKKDEVKKVKDENFERDVKMFLVDLGLLQKKYNVVMRPVITAFGPDLNLSRQQTQSTQSLKK